MRPLPPLQGGAWAGKQPCQPGYLCSLRRRFLTEQTWELTGNGARSSGWKHPGPGEDPRVLAFLGKWTQQRGVRN